MMTIAVILLFFTPLQAKAVIMGPTGCAPGDLCIFDATESVGSGYSWIVIPDTKNKIIVDGGKRLILSGRKLSKFYIVLAVADEKGAVSQVQHTIEITDDSNPQPGPEPKPPAPNPTPPNPSPNLTGFAKQVHDWILLHVDESDRVKALALSKTYRSVASAIAAGTLRLPSDILETVREKNTIIYGEEPKSWREWDKRLTAELKERNQNGSLRHPDDFRKVYLEVAKGLEAVR